MALSEEAREIGKNASWLIFHRVYSMAVGVLILSLTARYLGPFQYGLLSFAISFAAFFGLVAQLGLRHIVVRELLAKPKQQHEIMGSAFCLVLLAGVVACLAAILSISLLRPGDRMALLLVALCTGAHLFTAFKVIDLYFQSRVRSRFTVVARSAAFLISSCIKIALVLSQASLPLFAVAIVAETILESVACIIVYRLKVSRLDIWTYNRQTAGRLLAAGLPLLLSGIAIFGYTKIDQIMIGQILGDDALGIYSVAVRFSTAWLFIPTAIANSLFPALFEARKDNSRGYETILQRLCDTMALASLFAALLVSIFAVPVTALLFGEAYRQSADILILHVWCGVFISIGIASQHWFIVENLQRFTLYRTLAGCVVNVGLNIVVIPVYGLKGAAITTIIAQLVASYLFNALHPKTRTIFRIQSKALFIPRLPLSLLAYLRDSVRER